MPSTRERKATRRRQRNAPEQSSPTPSSRTTPSSTRPKTNGLQVLVHRGCTAPRRSIGLRRPSRRQPPPEAAPSMPAAWHPRTRLSPASMRQRPSVRSRAGPGAPSKRTGKSGTRGRDRSPNPEFRRRAQRQAFWRHPATRVALSFVTLGLLGSLCAASVFAIPRLDRRSPPWPALALVQLCAHAGYHRRPSPG